MAILLITGNPGRAQIIDRRPVLEKQVRAAGAVVLDATLPSLMLARRILREVAQRFP